MRYIDSRKGLYVHCGGVAWPGTGLEIKDRGVIEDAKPKLKGFFCEGFHLTFEEAKAKAETLFALKQYQLRQYMRGMSGMREID
jgi:hypothetical protein